MDIADLFVMGGYGVYVWSSVGLTILFVFIEVISLRRQYTKVMQRIRRIQQLRAVALSGDRT